MDVLKPTISKNSPLKSSLIPSINLKNFSWLKKINQNLKECNLESLSYVNCINKKGYSSNQYECEKEFLLLKHCLYSNKPKENQ